MCLCSVIFCSNECSKNYVDYCNFHGKLFKQYGTTNLKKIDKIRFQEQLSNEDKCVVWKGVVKKDRPVFKSYEHNRYISAKIYLNISTNKNKCGTNYCLNPKHYISN